MLGAYTERAVVGAQTASHACSEIFLLHLLSDPSKTDWSVGTAGADRIPPGVETEDPSDPGRMVGIELVPAGSSRPVFFLAMPKCAAFAPVAKLHEQPLLAFRVDTENQNKTSFASHPQSSE